MKFTLLMLGLLLLISPLRAQQNEEFRSFWVVTWEYISGSRTVDQNKARIRQILDYVKSANMNAVLWQVRQSGTAYYPSSYEPWGSYAGSSYPGFDPLAYALEESHKRGLEFHAWFNCFHASSTAAGTPVANHPEWVCRDQNEYPMTSGRALSPGLEEVRDYTIDVAMEIVRKYDIDGFHLDYVRWNEYTNTTTSMTLAKRAEENPGMDGMISDELLNDLNQNQAGRYLYDYQHPYSAGVPDSVNGGKFPSWEDWWRYGVTEFVRVLHDSIQAVKPWVRLSPAALGKYRWTSWQGYGTVYQDAALWFNKGYIDQLTPMHYHWLTGSSFYDMLSNPGMENWEYWIGPGIDAGRLFTAGPGSYRLAEENVWENHEGIINSCRSLPWVDGFQFFSFNWWEDNQSLSEARRIYFPTLAKIRGAGLIDDLAPDAPTVALQKIDSLTYDITVTPAAGINDSHWFAVYRSVDGQVDVTMDDIISIQFGLHAFTVREKFDGSQPASDRYTFAATSFDRFWNESDLSTTVETDSIPFVDPVINPPETPGHISVLYHDSGIIKVTCDTVASADGYTVYISTDAINFSDSVSSAMNTILLKNLNQDVVYYLRIKAYNQGGSSKLSKSLYAGVVSASPHEILIVNGFDRSTNTRLDYVGMYGVQVNTHGGPFSYTHNETVIAGSVSLRDFKTVIWILGDESTADETFSASEQAVVADFLKRGGNLMVSGAEIGWDLVAKGTTSDQAFYRSYLKADYITDAPLNASATYYSAESLPGSPFNGLAGFNFDNGTHGTYDVDWPDAIKAVDGAQDILQFKDVALSSGGAGIAYSGIFSGGTKAGKMIYLSIPFETIYSSAARNDVIQRIFMFFDGIQMDVNQEDMYAMKMPLDFSLEQNYPNPFNPVTEIAFSIDSHDHTRLTVFDMLGRVVKELINKEMPAGRHSIKFNAAGMASGNYIYILESGGRRLIKKMVLIR